MERALLVRLGAPLGNAIQEILSIAHYKTFLRWKRDEAAGQGRRATSRPPGRPPVSKNVEDLIQRFARETGWGYARIQGELKKLAINVAHNTIKKILIKNGFHPSPNRTKWGPLHQAAHGLPVGLRFLYEGRLDWAW